MTAVAAQLRGQERALVICATHGSDRALAEKINLACVAEGVPAVYYHAHELQVQLGPLVIPRQTACFSCYELRRKASMAPWERTLLEKSEDGGRLACALGVDWLAVDTLKFLSGIGEPVSRGRVLFIDYFTGLPEVHSVLRLPRCSVCGSPRRPAVRLWEQQH